MALCVVLQCTEQEVSAEQLVMGFVLSCSGASSTAAVGMLASAQGQLPELTEHSMQVKAGKQLVGGCRSAVHPGRKWKLVGGSTLCRMQPTGSCGTMHV